MFFYLGTSTQFVGTSNSQTQSSIVTSANSAYGMTEAAEIEEVANFKSNDA